MHNLKEIYVCPVHGDVDGIYYEDIDTESDEIYPMRVCSHSRCTHVVTLKKDETGAQCYRELSEEEFNYLMCEDEEYL